MITLNASGGSVSFTFSGNSTYLNDGVITCPQNSLALIIDESDMATFRKAASNDIFVSANIAEFGMTKDELIAWYKENMVGSTGGGGGVTTGEVQTMIDESISGKADTTTVEQELSTKLDVSAYTPTVVDAALSQSSTNPVQNKALYDELRVENETLLTFSDSIATNYPSGCTTIKVEVSGTGDMETIVFYDSNWGQIGYVVIDTIHGYIAVDNSLFEGSTYTINGNIVTISYPSITNVKYLNVPGNLYTYKAVTSVSTLKDVVSGKADTDSLSAYTINEGIASSSQTYVVETLPYGSQPSIVNTLDNSYGGLRVYKVNNYSTCYLIGYDENDTEIGRITFSSENPTIVDTTGFTDVIINRERISDSASTAIVEGKELTAIKKFSFYNNYWATDEETSVYFYNKAYNVTDAVRFDFAKKADGINVIWGPWPELYITLTSGERTITGVAAYFDSKYFRSYYDQYDNHLLSIKESVFQDYAKSSAVTAAIDAAVSGRVATSAVTSAVTSGSTDVLTSGGAYEQFGGLKIVKLTESEYAALVTKDPDVLYVVIPDPSNP